MVDDRHMHENINVGCRLGVRERGIGSIFTQSPGICDRLIGTKPLKTSKYKNGGHFSASLFLSSPIVADTFIQQRQNLRQLENNETADLLGFSRHTKTRTKDVLCKHSCLVSSTPTKGKSSSNEGIEKMWTRDFF